MNIFRFSKRSMRAGSAVAAAVLYELVAYLLGGEISLASASGDAALLLWAIGHCDTLDGPVVILARKALETGNVNHVLPWVRPEDEAEIRRAFGHATSVRRLGLEARELADSHFFETLVRVHRAAEGAPYTGLKPAGTDPGPAVRAADRALTENSAENVVKLLTDAIRAGVHRHFHAAKQRVRFAPDDVAAGRKYVEAYVRYIHYVEQLWDSAAGTAISPHHPENGVREHHPAHVH